jgi:hypothetical protein
MAKSTNSKFTDVFVKCVKASEDNPDAGYKTKRPEQSLDQTQCRDEVVSKENQQGNTDHDQDNYAAPFGDPGIVESWFIIRLIGALFLLFSFTQDQLLSRGVSSINQYSYFTQLNLPA